MAKTFDPKDYSLIVGGHIVEGFADGTFLLASRNRDTFALTVGADGEAARAKSNDKSGTLVFTLLQTSASNTVLSGFAQADELSNGGTVPVLVKDNNGDTVIEAAIAWVRKPADVELSNEITNREWTIESGNMTMLVGSVSQG
jgi:hypothetical protein